MCKYTHKYKHVCKYYIGSLVYVCVQQVCGIWTHFWPTCMCVCVCVCVCTASMWHRNSLLANLYDVKLEDWLSERHWLSLRALELRSGHIIVIMLCVCMCVCVCIYIYIYIYTYTHTHIINIMLFFVTLDQVCYLWCVYLCTKTN